MSLGGTSPSLESFVYEIFLNSLVLLCSPPIVSLTMYYLGETLITVG